MATEEDRDEEVCYAIMRPMRNIILIRYAGGDQTDEAPSCGDGRGGRQAERDAKTLEEQSVDLREDKEDIDCRSIFVGNVTTLHPPRRSRHISSNAALSTVSPSCWISLPVIPRGSFLDFWIHDAALDHRD